MKIQIIFSSGKITELNVHQGQTIEQLKVTLFELFKVPVQDQILLFNGSMLNTSKTYSELGIKEGSEIQFHKKCRSIVIQSVGKGGGLNCHYKRKNLQSEQYSN